MKKFLLIISILGILCASGCGKTKTLHCDNCNKAVKVKEKSNMSENWTIYCDACNEELFGDDPLLGK